MTATQPSLSPFVSVRIPLMCQRALDQNHAMVGLAAFGPEFSPEEGAAYLLDMRDGQPMLYLTPVRGAEDVLDPDYAMGAGDMLQAPIWPGTTHPDIRVVRFLQAFPEQNRWTMLSASNHPLTPPGVSHVWQRTDAHGRLERVEPPFEANGLAISQILTNHPVWPDANGVGHTLPALMSSDRAAFLRYQEHVAEAAGQPAALKALRTTFRSDPTLFRVQSGEIDPRYADYLRLLKEHDLLDLNRPYTAEDLAGRADLVKQVMTPRPETESTSTPRRSPRP